MDNKKKHLINLVNIHYNIFGLSLIMSCLMALQALGMDISYIKPEIKLSNTKIIAGEPVNLRFAFTNTSDGNATLMLRDGYNIWIDNKDKRIETEELKISIHCLDGNEIPRREILCRPESQSIVISGDVKSGETIIGDYPLHLRLSTILAPGKYQVDIMSYTLCYVFRAVEESKIAPRIGRYKCENLSGPSLLLIVEPYNEEALTAIYDLYMKNAQKEITNLSSWRGQDYIDIPSPVRTILWAEGPIAVSYQIDLVYDKKLGFVFWPPAVVNTWDNILRYATPEQIKPILEIAGEMESKPSNQEYYYSSCYSPGLVWAIHEWNTNGSEAIQELTQELANILPEEEPCSTPLERGTYPYGKI